MEWQLMDSAPQDGTVLWGFEEIPGMTKQIYYAMKFRNGGWVVDWCHDDCDPEGWMEIKRAT